MSASMALNKWKKEKPLLNEDMSTVKWAETRSQVRNVTTTQHVNLKKQGMGGQGGMVSYEDLLIAQYLDELRNTQKKRQTESAGQTRTKSPYVQKLPHSDYTYKYRTKQRPVSANTLANNTEKPKIDAKFIADPTMWDPATPRAEDEGHEIYTPIFTGKNLLNSRPASAPVQRKRLSRPQSAVSTFSQYGRARPWSGRSSYFGGKRIKSQYRKKAHTIRVTAFKNGTREPFVRLAAPSIKMLLEYCTEKLGMPFAARRIFLEDGVEVYDEKDIPLDAEVYISTGENYTDPYASAKRNIVLTNGAKWTLNGVTLPDEGKKKVSKPRLSKRMKKLADYKCVRVIVLQNGRSAEQVEIVADLIKMEEFLTACTRSLGLPSHARLLYDWEGNEVESLTDLPVLEEIQQPNGPLVWGPVWVSIGESFSPTGSRDFFLAIREAIKTRLKETKKFRKELGFKQDGEDEKIVLAVKILSMTKEEVEEMVTYTENEMTQFQETLQQLDDKLSALQKEFEYEQYEGTAYKMRHIKALPKNQTHKMLGATGLKLKVNENGTTNQPRDFYFNLRKAAQGADKAMILQRMSECKALLQTSFLRLLDELSGAFTNPQNPKLAPIAKKIFNIYGREITDVKTLQEDPEIWVSFGEKYISPFTFALQVCFDKTVGREISDDRRVVLREQLTPDSIEEGMNEATNYEATIGVPPTYKFVPPYFEEEVPQIISLANSAEVDQRGTFLQFMPNPEMVLYPELIMNHKLPKGDKAMWPNETQTWVVSKTGHIYCKPFPQLCLAVSDTRLETTMTGRDIKLEGYAVVLQKRNVGDPHQIWTFNTDATIASKAYPNMLITYVGKKFGDGSDDTPHPPTVKPGEDVYLVLTEPLKQARSFQRFAFKQERLDNLGQWKFCDATNPEWHKQALSWPVKANGKRNEDYDWPMEGYLFPNAPRLHKKQKDSEITGLVPLRLIVLKNGERNMSSAVPVVGPNLTNFMKDISKKPKTDGKKRSKQPEPDTSEKTSDTIELDVSLHCKDLTVRELEFTMFLDHCTSLMNLPFAGRRLFDKHGNEHFSLKTLKQDQLVFVSCGEAWSDPGLSKMEQQRRNMLSQLSQDVAKIRQFAALRNPENYVLEIDPSMMLDTPIVVTKQWTKDEEPMMMEEQSMGSMKPESVERDVTPNSEFMTSQNSQNSKFKHHELSHERSDRRLENLKWPWERLVNVNNSFDNDSEANKYTDKELYEKFKPKTVPKISRDTLQRFVFEDGYIALAGNRNIVLGVSEPEGRVSEVHLKLRKPDDIYQLWSMKENGEIRPRYSQQVVLTVSMPTNEPFAEDEQGRPLTFVGCKVTLQSRRTNEFGKAHQRWRYDAESGFIHAFYAELPDKEITAANRADVCTFAIASTTKIDQPGYIAEVPTQTKTERASIRRITQTKTERASIRRIKQTKTERASIQRITQTKTEPASIRRIMVCMSCARAMRGRYKLTKIQDNKLFSCAMGSAEKLQLQQIGSFCVVNGKVDLSTHEYELTLREWEDKLVKLMEETSTRMIYKEINVAKTIQTVKVLAYKNGEGRLRPGEIICGSSILGILNQATFRLSLNQAAVRMFTEDGTLIVEIEDLIDWAIQNYRSLMADHLESLYQGKPVEDVEKTTRGEAEGQEKQDKEEAETDQKEADKSEKQREYLLSQVRLPSQETILRYPIEIWVSSGKPFVPPEVVESKLENRKKKREFRSAVSLELDIEKHILRQMKGRRLEDMNPGEYKGTKNSVKPVVKEGHWEEVTVHEQEKHDTVHKLQEHLAEVKQNQKERKPPLMIDMNKQLYKQPDMKRVMAYPNGESIEFATYIWGNTFEELLNSATLRLNLWQSAKRFFNMEGKEITKFSAIQKDELLCVSTGKPFKPVQTSRLDVEVKANWSRAHKQYGKTSTDVHVEAPVNPKVNVDPFGPPPLALPLTNGTSNETRALVAGEDGPNDSQC